MSSIFSLKKTAFRSLLLLIACSISLTLLVLSKVQSNEIPFGMFFMLTLTTTTFLILGLSEILSTEKQLKRDLFFKRWSSKHFKVLIIATLIFMFANAFSLYPDIWRIAFVVYCSYFAFLFSEEFQRNKALKKSVFWNIGIYSLVLTISILYLWVGLNSNGNIDNDAAYYFGVASHMVRTGNFEEPIVWHFLNPPETIPHRPFDYWGGFTSIFLTIPLYLFDNTHNVAIISMSLISISSLILFAYVVLVLVPLTSRTVQLVSICLFSFSSIAFNFRFDTETIPIIHLLTLMSIAFIVRGNLSLASISTCLLVYTRRDSVFIASILFIGIVYCLFKDKKISGNKLFIGPFLVFFIMALMFFISNLILWGELAPKPASLAIRLGENQSIYNWNPIPSVSTYELMDKWTSFEYIKGRSDFFFDRMIKTNFISNRKIWYIWALIPAMIPIRRHLIIWISYLSIIVGGLALVIVGEKVFHSKRTLSVLLPFILIVGAWGLDTIIKFILNSCTKKGLNNRFKMIFVGGFIGYVLVVSLSYIRIYGEREVGRYSNTNLNLIDEITKSGTIITNSPFWIISHSKSPAISIPSGGEPDILNVINKYQAEWLVLLGDWAPGNSKIVVDLITKGQIKQLKNIKIDIVSNGREIKIYRLTKL